MTSDKIKIPVLFETADYVLYDTPKTKLCDQTPDPDVYIYPNAPYWLRDTKDYMTPGVRIAL